MGVPGLWDLIRPVGVRTSLASLARDAFLADRSGLRAFTIGIDASIWIFHAQLSPQAGHNPFLRTLFYRIATLLQHPVLPVFVFDGPKKPTVKRNQRIAGQFGWNDPQSIKFKQLLDVCGLEWWNAPGEAEAELALMNRQGKIDAVLSDDVDALLFGATCLLRNNSPTLTANKSTQSKSTRTDHRDYEMFRVSDILSEWSSEESAVKTEEDCRMAMVLIALLRGGDYAPEGVSNIGATIAKGLALSGCADFLKMYNTNRTRFDNKLCDAHQRLVDELRTNASGHIGRRYGKLASSIEDQDPTSIFAAIPLEAYLSPATSPSDDRTLGWPGFGKGDPSSLRGRARNDGRGNLEGMAKACERFFEWGTRDLVCKKFASDQVNLFGAEVVHEAREKMRTSRPAPKAMNQGAGSPERITDYFAQTMSHQGSSRHKSHSPSKVTPSHLVKIHSTRLAPTCPEITEYRVALRPECYVQRCRDAMDGTRVDPSALTVAEREALGLIARETDGSDRASSAELKDEIRIWIPEYLMRAAWPAIVKAYDDELAAKAARAAERADAKAAREAARAAKAASTTPKRFTKGKTKASAPRATTEDTTAFRSFFLSSPLRTVNSAPPPVRYNSSSSVASSIDAPSSDLSSPPSSPISDTYSSSDLSSLPPPTPPRSPFPDLEKRSHSVLSSSSASSGRRSPALKSVRLSPVKERKQSTLRSSSVALPASPKQPAQRSSAAPEAFGTADAPIDLCSSDDEPTPRPARTRTARSPSVPFSPTPVGRGSRTSDKAATPISRARPASKVLSKSPPTATKSITKPTTMTTTQTTTKTTTKTPTPTPKPAQKQSLLDSLIVARPASKAIPKPKASAPPAASEVRPQPPRVQYTVQEIDGVEHIRIKPQRRRAP